MPLIRGDKPLDVICQITRDGDIIPIKFRMADDEGVLQEYKVLGYRRVFDEWEKGVNTPVLSFECLIVDHNQKKVVKIHYIKAESLWFHRPNPNLFK